MFQVLRPGVIPKVTAPLQAPRRLRPSPGTAQPCQADVSGGSAELLARPGHQSTARGTRPGPRAARSACCAHLERAARLSVPGTRLRATALTHQRQTRMPPKTKPEGLPQFFSTEENLSSSFTFLNPMLEPSHKASSDSSGLRRSALHITHVPMAAPQRSGHPAPPGAGLVPVSAASTSERGAEQREAERADGLP